MNTDSRVSVGYYLYGIEHGIVAFSEAADWADKIIESEAEPSAEIIEIALSRSRGKHAILEALRAIDSDHDDALVSGAKLFHTLAVQLEQGQDLKSIARKAFDISWVIPFSNDVRFEFDAIEDEITLVEKGIYGDLGQCNARLLNALKLHATLPNN